MKHRENSSVSRGHTSRASASLLVTGGLLVAFAFSSCKPFDVNVATEEPIKVDLSMDVHVYQHGAESKANKKSMDDYKTIMNRRRDRMAEIQELKNNRTVGETHEGKLEIRNLPAAEYGNYVKETIRSENDDREFLIAHEAAEKSISADEVREAQWRHWQRKSFPGEWIEVEDGDGSGKYKWIQKAGADGE